MKLFCTFANHYNVLLLFTIPMISVMNEIIITSKHAGIVYKEAMGSLRFKLNGKCRRLNASVL